MQLTTDNLIFGRQMTLADLVDPRREYEGAESRMLSRVVREIRKNGPLTWKAARMAMSPHYDPRDAVFFNRDLQNWIRRGELAPVELPDGDSLIGLPG